MATFNLIPQGVSIPQPRGGFLSSLLDEAGKHVDNNQAAAAYDPLVNAVYGGAQPAQGAQGGGFLSRLLGGGSAAAQPQATPVGAPGQAQPAAQPSAAIPGPVGGATAPVAGQIDRQALVGMLRNPATREQAQAILMNGGRLPQPKSTLPTDLQEYQFAQGQGYKGSFFDYQTDLKKAGRSNNSTHVQVNAGGDNKQVFDAVAKSYESAGAAATGLNAIREARAAVDAGGIFGAGADARLGLQKVGAAFGIADPNVITNTETFRAAIAPQISAMLKATVGTTQISNADREFAAQAAGGSISLEPSTIKRLLNIAERSQIGAIEAHNKRLDMVYPDGGNAQRERALFRVQVPEYQPMTPPPASAPAAAKAAQRAPIDQIQPGQIVVQGGVQYEKQTDGSFKPVM